MMALGHDSDMNYFVFGRLSCLLRLLVEFLRLTLLVSFLPSLLFKDLGVGLYVPVQVYVAKKT